MADEVAIDPAVAAEVDQIKAAHDEGQIETLAASDASGFETEAARLRAASDALRDTLADARPSVYWALAVEKRRIDAEAFAAENAVRAIQDAVSRLDGNSVSSGLPFTWEG